MVPRFVIAVPVLVGLALAAPSAQAEPPYPKVDFQGDFVASDGSGGSMRMRMRYSATAGKMRIDMEHLGMSMSSVRSMPGGEMVMWSDKMPGMAMRLPTVKDDEFDAEPTGETRTVGGFDCAVWTIKGAKACLTDDNIPLEVAAADHVARLENLELVAQDPGLFQVPDGVQVMDMPTSLPGGAGGMIPGGLIPGGALPF